jgi:hypothetical protein
MNDVASALDGAPATTARPRFGDRSVIAYLGLAWIGIATVFFFIFVLPSCRIFPYSDEWWYIPPWTDGPPGRFLWWLLAQHNDHRIPLQKIVYVVALKLSGYDFRAIIGVNYILAGAICASLMATTRRYRGYASLGDLIIPAFTLNLGAGHTAWGFLLSFLSATLFATLFLHMIVIYETKRKSMFLDLAILALLACALCGMNGMIISSAMTVTFLALPRADLMRPVTALLAAATVATNVVLWITWVPSDAANVGGFDAARVAGFFYGLITSSLIAAADGGTVWKAGIMVMLVCAALWFGTRSVIRDRGKIISTVVMLGMLCATLLLMLSIAFGRTKDAGWFPADAVHFGYATILMPIVSWILVSSHVGRKNGTVAGALLVALFGWAYWVNMDRRIEYATASAQENAIVQSRIASAIDADELARNNIFAFFTVNSQPIREVIATGIKTLRREGGRHYRSVSIEP